MEKVELKTLKVADLEHAPWNPRSAEELAWDNPAMVELIESVKAGGINQSLAVWDRGKGEPLLVIAGNRRLEAARACDLRSVPALVYVGISEGRAHEITRAENEMRRGIDPLRDAELIGRMLKLGVSQKTVAAHFAMSEAMVCRRVKLLGLIDEVREVAASKHNIATDALEQIALYPEETQRECLSAIKRIAGRSGSTVRWGDLKYDFDRQTRSLDGAKFDTSCCVACPLRTGAQPDLWGEVAEDGKLGSCLKCECYERHLREYLAGLVAADVGSGVQLVDAEAEGFYPYQISNRTEFGPRKSKRTPVAWWFWESYSDKLTIFWGPTLEAFRATLEAEDAEREAAAEKERNISDEERAKREAEADERKRLAEERSALRDALGHTVDAILVHIPEKSAGKFQKLVKAHVVGKAFKGAAAAILAEIVDDWFYDCAQDDEDSLRVLLAFPALLKALKVKPAELKAYHVAAKALADFDKKNYRGE